MSIQEDKPKTIIGLDFTQSEIDLRKRWLELSAADEKIISEEINQLVGSEIDDLIKEMYAHFLTFEETSSFFPDDTTLKRAQQAQKHYFKRLTKGNYDTEYVNNRLLVGAAHHRIELGPAWYIGAYNRALSWFLPKIVAQFKNNSDKLCKTLSALFKLIFFDMSLAIDCYIWAKESSIKKHRDAIRELETERRVTKSILESAPIGIVSLSENFVCLECNDEFVDIIDGGNRQTVVGRLLFEVAPGLKRELFEKILKTGQAYKRTAELLNLSKSYGSNDTYWDWAMWPVKDDSGKVTGMVAMFANSTDRVLLQQQREDFVATLTHDLKTPVSATNRAVRFLLDGDFGTISEPQKEILETILQSNTALYQLVQTLLDVYRFDSGAKEMNMRKCSLSSIITQMVTQIMPLAQEKGVTLNSILPTNSQELLCDEEEIRRVIQNLIDNSLKFTPTGGSITVSMHQEEKKTTISVTDTGKGVPEENKPKLFQRFWQAGSTGRYYASTGLGLYLSRRIVEAHNGQIWCESEVGKGSTFQFELPLNN
jgi:signal transduction histidine kinase